MEITQFGSLLSNNDKKIVLIELEGILNTKNSEDFIGCHPVTLTRKGIADLLEKDYFVCEKSDGIRALLLIYKSALVLYDRKCNFYLTKYRIKNEKTFLFDCEIYEEWQETDQLNSQAGTKVDNPQDRSSALDNTQDRNSALDKIHVKYTLSIFDTLIYENKDCTRQNLMKRLGKSANFVQNTLLNAIYRHNRNDKTDCTENNSKILDFNIIDKKMLQCYNLMHAYDSLGKQPPSDAHKLTSNEHQPAYRHLTDGLIFTPVDDPYEISKRVKIYKWKPPHLNTVDFLISKTNWPFQFNLSVTIDEVQEKILGCYAQERIQKGHNSNNQYLINSNQSHGSNTYRSNSVVYDVFYTMDHKPDEINGKIGEFWYNDGKEVLSTEDYTTTNGGWELHKIRTDKKNSNNVRVAMNILESISESISIESLAEVTGEMKRRYLLRKE